VCTHEVARSIAGVAEGAAETGRMAQDVFNFADALLAESVTLENEIGGFLREVRSA
jgi:hypothetical protein